MDIVERGSPPWGQWIVLYEETEFKVKRIEVLPGHRLSYQKHTMRMEHWFIVKGVAKVTINDQDYILSAGQSVDIEYEVAHRIENFENDPLVFVEIQRGSYFGEDDIVRLSDDYGRQ
jgi:mannose-6-phosphate isomerase-like protein (cupin superfamily)